jgi:hypothetical protein
MKLTCSRKLNLSKHRRLIRVLYYLNLPISANSLSLVSSASEPVGAFSFLHLMIKPHTPAPRANEVIFPSIEEMGDAVSLLVKQRPVVIAQGSVRRREFDFALFVIGVVGHQTHFSNLLETELGSFVACMRAHIQSKGMRLSS